MLIGILQTGEAPESLRGSVGDYPDMFETLLAGRGFDFRTWQVVHMEFPDSVHAADGWLLTGSRHGAYEDHPFIKPLEGFIRDAYAAEVPMVGICFGHQIIAQALGGKVVKFPGGWNIGAQQYDFEGTPITLNAWHQDQVVELPPDARVVGSAPTCENAALVYGKRAYTVQAHPEFRDAAVQGLLDSRARGTVPDPLIDQAQARLGTPLSAPTIADRIADFFQQDRG
ncbi:type 1 glutamine amidotransferase [Thioclava sp. BHET1]|nr:type 1 glutamine amidotransferase [Thioclava sp. BHET1]